MTLRRLIALILTLGGASALLGGSAPAAAPPDRCRVPADASDVKRGARTIAFRADLNELGPGLWACLRSERQRRLVTADDSVGESVVLRFLVAGPFVGWSEASPAGCKAGCPPGADGPERVGIFDVRTGDDGIGAYEEDIGTIGLTRGGIVVWTALDPRGARVVRYAGLRSAKTLDRGEIDLASLRVRGRTATWTSGGVVRTARLPAR